MIQSDAKLGVAIVGCGTVGGAAGVLLTRDAGILGGKIAPRLELRYLVDVDFSNARQQGLDERLFCKDFARVLADPSVGAVVELIGGLTTAKDVIVRALSAGKNVVTANKALLAHAGPELCALARKNGVCIAFEGSCGGGIPIIRALCGGLIANRIDALYGIVNGTCNYILTAMSQQGQTYAQALADAQAKGLAEADPSLDVEGYDSAHKLAILAGLALGWHINVDSIPVEGIDHLDAIDLNYGRELGYVVKLLAIAQRQSEGVSLRVRPAFISVEHPLAWVSGPFNAISVYGHATGHTMYYGRGAGGMPTASAVLADLADVAMGTATRAFSNLSIMPDVAEEGPQLPLEAIRSRYYIRMRVADQPGVLAMVATILGNYGISILSVLQHEQAGAANGSVPLVITTHRAQEGAVRKALAEIDALPVVKTRSVCIGIVEEHPEEL
ncbi:MAG: homoserine dehydrogenase [Planctomycetaceae bacterium]|nr:homoserine dehydrogenase [Planctomycetaceae bacterium]